MLMNDPEGQLESLTGENEKPQTGPMELTSIEGGEGGEGGAGGDEGG